MKVSVPLSKRLKRGDLLAAACPSREVLMHVTSRWGVLVLMVLEDGTHRFSEVRRAIGGVSERMLAQTLQWLEADGLVKRVARDVVPPHVEYSLTPLGRAAARKVRALADWVEINLPRVMAARESRAAANAAPQHRGRIIKPWTSSPSTPASSSRSTAPTSTPTRSSRSSS